MIYAVNLSLHILYPVELFFHFFYPEKLFLIYFILVNYFPIQYLHLLWQLIEILNFPIEALPHADVVVPGRTKSYYHQDTIQY